MRGIVAREDGAARKENSVTLGQRTRCAQIGEAIAQSSSIVRRRGHSVKAFSWCKEHMFLPRWRRSLKLAHVGQPLHRECKTSSNKGHQVSPILKIARGNQGNLWKQSSPTRHFRRASGSASLAGMSKTSGSNPLSFSSRDMSPRHLRPTLPEELPADSWPPFSNGMHKVSSSRRATIGPAASFR